MKLGSPVLLELFQTCDGKNVYECRKAIPRDHPDLKKIGKAVEIFNSWFPDYVDVDDSDNEDVVFVEEEVRKFQTEDVEMKIENVEMELVIVNTLN